MSNAYHGLCTVIPAFNAGKTLVRLLRTLRATLPETEIIVVNDGSTDDTRTLLNQLSDIHCIHHEKNLGKGQALRSGFRLAGELGTELIASCDADGQHSPSDLQGLVKTMLADPQIDMLIGSRMHDLKTMPLHRRCSNTITSKLVSWRLGQPIEDSQSGLRVYRARSLAQVLDQLECRHFDLETELLLRMGIKKLKISAQPIQTIYPPDVPSAIKVRDIWRFASIWGRSFFWNQGLAKYFR